MQQQLETIGCDRLTALKAAQIRNTGDYKISGVILRNDRGDSCHVEFSAVRWLNRDQMWNLMHSDSNPPVL